MKRLTYMKILGLMMSRASLHPKEKLAKNKEARHVGEVVGGKNKRAQKRYEDCTLTELKQKASKRNVKGYSSMNKTELIKTLRK